MKKLSMAFVLFLVCGARAEQLTFVGDSAATSNGQYLWADKRNWQTASGAFKAPTEGDSLLIAKSINNYHAANAGAYVTGIRFARDVTYNGVSWSGFYMKAGGEGFVSEGGRTGDKTAYSRMWLDGAVTVNITNGWYVQSGFGGRSATQRGRIVKWGPGKLRGPIHNVAEGNYWDGATIHEGVLQLDADNGRTGADILFDAPAAGARFYIPANIALKNGGLGSVNDDASTDFGVMDNNGGYALTLSGTPKRADQVFGGALLQKTSFVFAPDAPASTFTFRKAASTTSGSLKVQSGTVRVADGAAFTALATLEVGSAGTFAYAADAGEFNAADVLLAAGAKLDVADGAVLVFRRVALDGAEQAGGDYAAATCGWVSGAGTVRVDPRLDYVDPLYFDVAQGETRTFAQALADYNAAHGTAYAAADLDGGSLKGCTFVKTGGGRLNMDVALPGFEGVVQIEAGLLSTEVRYAIGKESNPNAPVVVWDGATFHSLTTSTTMNVGRTFRIRGNGAPSWPGALRCGACAVSGNYGLGNVFGANVVLEGDATCNIGSWIYLGSGTVRLNGHRLTLVGNNSGDCPVHLPAIVDQGEVELKGAELRYQGGTELRAGAPASRIVCGERGGFRFADVSPVGAGLKNWTLQFKGPNNVWFVDYNMQPRDASQNNLTLPVELDTAVSFKYQVDRKRGYLKAWSPISGAGGLACADNRVVFLHLLNAANSFRGGLSFTRGTIWAYPNGSVPNGEDAGPVRLAPTEAPYSLASPNATYHFLDTFDGIAFMTPDEYALPDLEIAGTFPSRVQGGRGSWRNVVLKNTGGAEYYSGVGAKSVDVRQGVLKLPRGAAPGLWEGTNVYANAAAAETAYAEASTATNLAVRGPTMVIRRSDFNYTVPPANARVTYSGYVWNRGASDVTWTFASASTGRSKLLVDGAEVLSGAGGAPVAGNVTLSRDRTRSSTARSRARRSPRRRGRRSSASSTTRRAATTSRTRTTSGSAWTRATARSSRARPRRSRTCPPSSGCTSRPRARSTSTATATRRGTSRARAR